MIYRLNLAKLTSHIHCISPEAEATLFIEHLFSAIRDQTKLQMPDLLACARGLTTANLIQMIIGGWYIWKATGVNSDTAWQTTGK